MACEVFGLDRLCTAHTHSPHKMRLASECSIHSMANFYDFLLRFRCLSFVRPVILPTNYKCRVLWNRFCKCDPNRRKQKQLSNKKRHNCAVWIQPMNRASFGWVFLFTANFMSAAFSFSLLLHCIHFMDKMYAMIYYQNQSHVKHFALKTAISIGQSWELCVLCGFSTLLCWWQQLQSSNYLRKWMSLCVSDKGT